MQKVDLMESKSSGLRNAACSGPAYEPVTLATRVRIPAKASIFNDVAPGSKNKPEAKPKKESGFEFESLSHRIRRKGHSLNKDELRR